MTDRVRQQVFDYLLGTLDESEMEEVRARLASDPAYRHALRAARGELGRLRGIKCQVAPPPQLAERTCDFVFDPVQRLRASKARMQAMTPASAAPQSCCRLSWADVIVAAAIFLIAGLLILPAIIGSRFQSRVNACQDNLRHVGQAMTDYSRKNNDIFPQIPVEGHLAADGIWAPVLKEQGYLTESQKVLCPESTQAQPKDFHIPSLDELRKAAGRELSHIQQRMGGSYGYCLGYFEHGAYRPTRNLNRESFAILADAPSPDRPDHQSANHCGRGQNVLFEDMHVGFCTTTRPGAATDDIYFNDNHEVAPGLNRDDSVIAFSETAPVGVP